VLGGGGVGGVVEGRVL